MSKKNRFISCKGVTLGLIGTFAAIMTVSLPSKAIAESVIERVALTGVLTAGTSKDAIPFAYINRNGQQVGYSVDMLNLVKEQLEKQLGKKIQLKLVTLAPEERIPKIINGEVDIVCDASSFTWDRDKKVDFSISYGVTGTQLLVKRESNLGSPESLFGKRVAVLPKTTNEQALKQIQPRAKLVYVKDRAQAYSALQQGKVDAIASDGILLEGWLETQKNYDKFKVVPGRPYSREGIACMVPENNSNFLDSVNLTLYKFMQGFVAGKSRNVAIFDRWFGPQGIIPLNRDLRGLAVDTMQLTIESRQKLPNSEP